MDRTARLVNPLLDLARIEDGGATSEASEPLQSIVQPLAGARSVALQIEGNGAAFRVEPVHLGLALRNVVEDALNATPPGSTVTLALSGAGIEVRDAGPGIDWATCPM